MRLIQKGAPPNEIVPYRNDATTDFDDFRPKEAIRTALLREQGFLCCYCMRRIAEDAMKIEHWAAQTTAPGRRFDWTNLLGACKGGEGRIPAHRSCDTHKKADAITVLPTNPDHVSRVRCRASGRIESADREIQHDLDETLNLNNRVLVAARQRALAAARDELMKRHRAHWSVGVLSRELTRWRPPVVSGPLREFCEVVAQDIEQRLARG